ncbi:hypothetical protein JCM10212_004091, partial [Sporobolomyces blumeae]
MTKPRRNYPTKGRRKTRSDQPKLIQDADQEEKVLNEQLRENGLYAANILGDGNCLFRALSDQLYGSPSSHLSIRSRLCDELDLESERYRVFVDEDEYRGGWNGYVREMRQPGTYGTHIELSAFVRVYKRPIKIFQPGLVYVMQVDDDRDDDDDREDDGEGGGGEDGRGGSSARRVRTDDRTTTKPLLTAREKRALARAEKVKAKEARSLARTTKANAKAAKGKRNGGATRENDDESESRGGGGGGRGGGGERRGSDDEDGPLCIVYHSWEHYSSLRNLTGPHTGLPRLRI